MSPELQHELQKLNTDLAGAVELIHNPVAKLLARAVVARLVKILHLLAAERAGG